MNLHALREAVEREEAHNAEWGDHHEQYDAQ